MEPDDRSQSDTSNPKIAELLSLFVYHIPNESQVMLISAFRDRLHYTVDALLSVLPLSAEVVVAVRKLHEASMAINAAIVMSGVGDDREVPKTDAENETIRDTGREAEGVPRKKKRRTRRTA